MTMRLALAAGTAFVAIASFGPPAGAVTTAPYTDPRAVGSIGLCDQSGQQITSGSTASVPFAPLAVSTTPATSPYDATDRTAVLLAYQPQRELPPGEWSGAQLTSSTRYSNPSTPMAAGTARDGSLADFMADFAPRWNGFLQLRMYLGAPDEPAFNANYPTLDIQVVGDTWHAVGGAQVNCRSGTATSDESLITITTPTTSSPSTTGGTGGQTATGGTTTGSGTGAAPGPTGAVSGSTPGGTSSGGSTPTATPITATQSGSSASSVLIVVLIVLLIAGAAWFLVRRRRPNADPGSADPAVSGAEPTGPGPVDPDVTDLHPEETVSSSSSSSTSEQ
jgi:LPXTG-motif cell wall-anchored protein